MLHQTGVLKHFLTSNNHKTLVQVIKQTHTKTTQTLVNELSERYTCTMLRKPLEGGRRPHSCFRFPPRNQNQLSRESWIVNGIKTTPPTPAPIYSYLWNTTYTSACTPVLHCGSFTMAAVKLPHSRFMPHVSVGVFFTLKLQGGGYWFHNPLMQLQNVLMNLLRKEEETKRGKMLTYREHLIHMYSTTSLSCNSLRKSRTFVLRNLPLCMSFLIKACLICNK